MEYTVKRFQQAFSAFIPHPEPEAEIVDLASLIDNEPYYHLRRRTKRKLSTLGMPWVDNDTTETYDPLQDLPRPRRKLTSERRDGQSSRSHKRIRNLSPASLEAVQNKIQEQEKSKKDAEERRRQEEEAFLSSGPFDYNLRARNKTSEASVKRVKNAMNNGTDTGGPDTPGAFPTRNECLACRELQIECSLIEDSFYYPCSDCRHDGIECKLDPPPTRKRPCEGCRRRRTQCSYNFEDYDHRLPCHWCLQHGFDCVAGPARKQPPAGQSQGSNTEMADDLPRYATRRIVTIGATDGASDGTGHSGLNDSSQVSLDSDAESEATMLKRISVITGSSPTSNTIAFDSSQAASPHAGGRSYQPPTGLQSFLKLWHEIPIDGSQPCNWCYNFAYGIAGYAQLYSGAMSLSDDRYNGQRYAYMQWGEPSRMCINCTNTRVAILKCPHDKIESLSGAALSQPEVRSAFGELDKALMALQPGSRHAGEAFPSPGYPWCSICREPAFYQCAKPQASTNTEWSFGQYIPSNPGCGLYLCDYCAHYAKVYRGDLDAVVKRGREDPNNKTEFHADVEFILKRSPVNVFKQLAGLE